MNLLDFCNIGLRFKSDWFLIYLTDPETISVLDHWQQTRIAVSGCEFWIWMRGDLLRFGWIISSPFTPSQETLRQQLNQSCLPCTFLSLTDWLEWWHGHASIANQDVNQNGNGDVKSASWSSCTGWITDGPTFHKLQHDLKIPDHYLRQQRLN